ncbi:MAG: hypothetical protein BJ554DRAFT_3795 [Olpidium bornovanus]|uniref:Uncharacterized protein n=1 Tax=Olpidium bornovanus TaxID=278681 RepID=A0A8H7ZN01_9FUNG|nr:MAG: hypothetical protein BJ554DRAFT_3795 [Olpidium bornovanus]
MCQQRPPHLPSADSACVRFLFTKATWRCRLSISGDAGHSRRRRDRRSRLPTHRKRGVICRTGKRIKSFPPLRLRRSEADLRRLPLT